MTKRKLNEQITSGWDVDEIVEGPVMKKLPDGKVKRCFKVKWSESYECESNIPRCLVDHFINHGRRVVRVLGPVIDEELREKSSSTATSMENSENTKPMVEMPQFNPQRAKFAVEIDGDVKLMNYKDVRAKYKDQLLTYYEERAKVFSVAE